MLYQIHIPPTSLMELENLTCHKLSEGCGSFIIEWLSASSYIELPSMLKYPVVFQSGFERIRKIE